jgi:enamine deaminase RidA (YjgF/YER057c/UK114 family)
MKVERELETLGLKLPDPPTPAANYVPAVRVGSLLFLSGHVPRLGNEIKFKGKVGRDLTLEQGYEAARLVMLNCLATIKNAVGDLDHVERIVKLLGFVNASDGFLETPKVLNGASDLLVQLYGEKGRHARSAIGTSTLPFDIAVEIEMIVQLKEGA